MNEIIRKIDDEISERENRSFIAAYNIQVEKAKSYNHGELKGLELAKQIIQAEYKESTIIINLPSLSDQDIKDYKDKLKEIFDEKEKYEQMFRNK